MAMCHSNAPDRRFEDASSCFLPASGALLRGAADSRVAGAYRAWLEYRTWMTGEADLAEEAAFDALHATRRAMEQSILDLPCENLQDAALKLLVLSDLGDADAAEDGTGTAKRLFMDLAAFALPERDMSVGVR